MWVAEYSIDSDASPEVLWRLLSDVEGWGAWNEGIESISLNGPLAVGARFEMKPQGQDVLTSSIAELDHESLLTDVTDLGELIIRVQHRLQPLAAGTKITYQIEVSGPAAEAMGAEVGTAVSADFPAVLAALSHAASHQLS